LQVWIRTADRAADQSLTQDFRGTLVFCGPATSGGGERLCLARNLRAMPICDGDITRMSQTAESRNPMSHPVGDVARRHQVLHSFDGADRDLLFRRWQSVHFLPEDNGIAQLALRQIPEPDMFLPENERLPTLT